MKKMRRFAAIAAAAAMTACMAVPMMTSVFAADPITSGSITITTEETDHAYNAYQIFDGDLAKESDSTITFSNVNWGSGVVKNANGVPVITVNTEEVTIYQALYNLSIMKDDVNVFSKEGAVLASAADVATALGEVASGTEVTFTDIDKIADVFVDYKAATATAANGEYSDGKYVIDISDPGYYLVVESKSGNELADGEAVTKYMLQVADNASLSPKADAPEVMKKVKEDSKNTADIVTFDGKDYTLAAGYNDVADYDIGETINFTLYGSLPTTFANYTGYYYQFTDNMGAGLDLVGENTTIADSDFVVTVTDGTTKVKLNADQYDYAALTGNEKGFTITIPNLKAIDMSDAEGMQVMSSSAIITVDYKAKLNANAVIGNNGNPNDVFLTYSNNSNTAQGNSTDETNETKKDYNVVFTYELDVTKYLGEKNATGSNTADNQTGTQAGFKLYKGTGSDKQYAVLEVDSEGVYKFKEWTADVNVATQVVTDAEGTFEFSGIQDGVYYLTETLVPTGYNTMVDKKVEITASTSNNNAGTCQNYNETSGTAVGNALTKLEISVDGGDAQEAVANSNNGKVAMEIENLKGSSLPSTGGIGTTLFYVIGGTLAAGAGVSLIAKKRMKNEE